MVPFTNLPRTTRVMVTVRKLKGKSTAGMDVEHRRWPGATVFLGPLRGMNPQSSLKALVSHSHLIEAVPQGRA